MTRKPRSPAAAPLTPVEAIARLLVASLLPELEAAMLGGFTFRETMDNARRVCGEAWRAQHGPVVAARAREILEAVGPAAILTPYGREVFLREYPLSAMARDVPRPLNDNGSPPSPPPGEIGRRWTKALADLFRVPPAAG